jgi:hypothetical protein
MSRGQDPTFDFPGDLSPFPRATQDLLRMAHTLGWAFRWAANRKMVAITSPVERTKRVSVPTTNMNDNRHKSIVSQIGRYSDPDALLDYIDSQTTVRGSAATRLALNLGVEPPRVPAPKPEPPKTAVAAAMAEAERLAAAGEPASTTEASQAEHAVSQTCDTEADKAVIRKYDDSEGVLVAEKPWMVRRGGTDGSTGRMYESPSVIERVWNDGTTDYRCRYCDWANDNPRSVAGHASRRKDHPAAPQRDQQTHLVPDYEQSDIKRPRSAIRRLRSDLLHALDGIKGWREMDPAELALAVAEAVYEERPDREPAEPLTPEQIIHRITFLVDSGRLAEMHQSVERTAAALVEQTDARNRLTGEVTTLQQQLTTAQAEVERLHEERRVLRDLLSESEAS